MAKEYKRSQRVADYLKRELSLIIQKQIRDPRVGMVNVNDVQVSRDISHAKVYVTFIDAPSEAEAAEPLDVLNKAAGFLRSTIAAEGTMRSTPKLKFFFDVTIERSQRVSSLISQAIKADEKFRDGDDVVDDAVEE